MRREFAKALFDEMAKDERIVVITADLGFGMWDKIEAEYEGRFYNVGAAEQLMVGMGAGMALAGKIPVCYSITSFAVFRPYEWIRNYMEHEGIPVKIVGGGQDKDYIHDGISHWAEDIKATTSHFKTTKVTIPTEFNIDLLQNFLYSKSPEILILKR